LLAKTCTVRHQVPRRRRRTASVTESSKLQNAIGPVAGYWPGRERQAELSRVVSCNSTYQERENTVLETANGIPHSLLLTPLTRHCPCEPERRRNPPALGLITSPRTPTSHFARAIGIDIGDSRRRSDSESILFNEISICCVFI
jgi:hypothetical protein